MEKMKPILFSTPMVQAILAGRKTQTRRVVPLSFKRVYGCICANGKWSECMATTIEELSNELVKWYVKECAIPKYNSGDILWVRETWQKCCDLDGNDQPVEKERYVYAASPKDVPHFDYWVRPDGTYADTMPWRPSIFMPREAARLFLRVTDVRVEQVQEGFFAPTSPILTLEAEGIAIGEDCEECLGDYGFPCCIDEDSECGLLDEARSNFIVLWDSLNAKRGYGWAENPWVWVYKFERVEKPPYI